MGVRSVNKNWDSWVERFERYNPKVITPNNSMVVSESRRIRPGSDDVDRALNAWDHVMSRIEYGLSPGWKTPQETLKYREADCEDFTFLLASLFPNLGIKESKVVVGELISPTGKSEFHTWNVVAGRVIDATGTQKDVEKLQYKEAESWRIVT